MSDFYPVGKVLYEGAASKNPFAFRYYNPDERIAGKSMRDHLRFAMSWWHTMVAGGRDMFGGESTDKSFGASGEAVERARVDAGFEMMEKLGIPFYCYHDYDLIQERATLAESNAALAQITDYMLEKQKQTGIGCLWATSNLFSSPRYMHGAGTSPEADVFAYAAGQVKQNIDCAIKLGAQGLVFWGGREGYETLLNTDMALELDNLARFLRMAIDYAREHGFQGDFYIEPKPKEPTKHQYDFDAATTISFLRKYNLDKDMKLNIECNHATLAGHTFEHELRTAAINGMLGSIDANQGDMLIGWDTDQFPTDVYTTTYCMLEVLRAGGFDKGGLNFDAKNRRGSNTPEDVFYAYIAGMDAYALGLRLALKIQADGRLDEFVRERYQSWRSGIGRDIASGKATLQSLSDYALQLPALAPKSGRQEYLENLVNRVIFG